MTVRRALCLEFKMQTDAKEINKYILATKIPSCHFYVAVSEQKNFKVGRMFPTEKPTHRNRASVLLQTRAWTQMERRALIW